MKLLKSIVLTMIVLGAVQAASITHNSSAVTNFAPSNLLFAPDIPLFDPTLGTLTQVDIEFEGAVEGDFTFTNNGAAAGTVTGSAVSQFILIGPGGLGNLIVLNPAIAFNSAVPALSAVSVNDVGDSANGSYTSSLAGVLAAFTGLGNVAFSGTVTQVSSPNLNFSPSSISQSVTNTANLAVTYTFTPDGPPNEVPEPRSWAFMAGGGLLLMAAGRYRKQAR